MTNFTNITDDKGNELKTMPYYFKKDGGIYFEKNGKVSVSSDVYEATDVATSLYSVKQSAGVMLSFDTYNEIFHFYSDNNIHMRNYNN